MAIVVTPLQTVGPRAYVALITATLDADTTATITVPFPYRIMPANIVTAAGVFFPLSPFFYVSQWYYGPGAAVDQIVVTKVAAVGSGNANPQAQITMTLLDGINL